LIEPFTGEAMMKHEAKSPASEGCHQA